MSLEHSRAAIGSECGDQRPILHGRRVLRCERMSRAMLYKAWAEGWGPDFYWVGVTRRITHRARLEWQRQREAEAAAGRAEK